MSSEIVNVDCIIVNQPIGEFYVGKVKWQDLVDIAAADIRRIENEGQKDVDTYMGIQRTLSPNRVNEISQYVKNVDASFPSSIILHIPKYELDDEGEIIGQNVDFIELANNMSVGALKIKRSEKIASIIDGQHRIEGLKKGLSENDVFDLIVTIFVDMDIEAQSMLFATVNKAQTKVNKSLVYDLFDLANSRSPQRTAHNIVRKFNYESSSPFIGRIKILGTARNKEKETITQATIVELILAAMSKNPMQDRDLLIRGKSIDKLNSGPETSKFYLRNLFVEKRDEDIYKILENYFNAVKTRWSIAWEQPANTQSGFILNKSTGIVALMRFHKDLYNKISQNKSEALPTTAQYLEYLNKSCLSDNDFTTERYKPGGSGQSKLYNDFKNLL